MVPLDSVAQCCSVPLEGQVVGPCSCDERLSRGFPGLELAVVRAGGEMERMFWVLELAWDLAGELIDRMLGRRAPASPLARALIVTFVLAAIVAAIVLWRNWPLFAYASAG